MLDAELVNARKLLDESEIKCKWLIEDNANLKNRLEKKIEELDAAVLLDHLQKGEISKLEAALKELHKRLDEEKLARIKAESLVESLRVKPTVETSSVRKRLNDIIKVVSIYSNVNNGTQILISNFVFFLHTN